MPIQVMLVKMLMTNKGIYGRLLAHCTDQIGLDKLQFYELHSCLQWTEIAEMVSTQRQLLLTLVWL